MTHEATQISILESQIEHALLRARKQEGIYGHNTGHFTLQVEKENTVIGVLGELLVRDFLNNFAISYGSNTRIELTDFGFHTDLISVESGGKRARGIHVKTGLWQNWPKDHFEFGIHADQRIERSQNPLVLVSLLKNLAGWPITGRIEGYISASTLMNAKIIKRGDSFPSTGIISRTNNLVTRIDQYQKMETLAKHLFENSL